ncbi:Eco57I restriction-modification methylase domain-containing protein [Roseivirga pacifica]|uniref:Eco57I restriction-modification methylase domain-containing protein n=1 Tax=Roseivirga pacifica TaxID=1267423 RepID=UPI003BAA600B
MIKKLVENFEKELDFFKSTKYNEAQLRADFLDPFFTELGWDLKNAQGLPTYEREVVIEEPLKADANSNTKKPDYTFRLFNNRKFFVEAKKPHVNIEREPEPALQVRRYGFTAKLKVSVLTNFEYLIIYDCSVAIDPTDPVNKALISMYHFKEYVDKFEEIKSLLGRDSVYDGSFDKNWEHIEDRIQSFSVDDLFLAQINKWRLVLGQEIISNNPDLTISQLNDLVQRCINSIIFLRVCEDRNIEVFRTLLAYAEEGDFRKLINLFQTSDSKYNAGLFRDNVLEKVIEDSHSAFWGIIKELYYPNSPYSFAVLASDILGNIYELFLGETLKVSEGQVSLVKKPEHVDRDIITTPTEIIQDILSRTATSLFNEKTDDELLNTKIGDISCGSGAFLLEVYELLISSFIDFYKATDQTKLIKTAVDTFKLPYELKKQVLVNCIYGVDKDYNAIQACRFGLLLKLLEGEDSKTISAIPILPDLSSNIEFGNSLIENGMIGDNQESINPYSFGQRKFDLVVGNPPYMATEHMTHLLPLEIPVYKTNYSTAYKQFDKYFLFIERGLNLLKDGGYLGYIVPSKFNKVGAGKNLRILLKENTSINQLISFGANQVFKGKTTYTCLLICQKTTKEKFYYTEIKDYASWKLRDISDEDLDEVDFSSLDDDGWSLVPGYLRDSFDKILNKSSSLEELLSNENISNGIQTSANKLYIHKATNEDKNTISFVYKGKKWTIEKELTRPYFKTSKGEDNLNTYRPFQPNAFVIYPYKKVNDRVQFVEIDALKENYPLLYDFLITHKADLDNGTRDIKPEPETANEWYRYGRHQALDKCDVPEKIIVGVMSQGDKYAIDFHHTLISSGGTAGYCMITIPQNLGYSIYYIQAVLNSKYCEWFAGIYGEVFRGGFIARGTKVLKRLPIPVIDFSIQEQSTLHNEIARTQKELIHLQEQIDLNKNNPRSLEVLNRTFKTTKDLLNEKLTALFGLEEGDNKIPLVKDLYAVN